MHIYTHSSFISICVYVCSLKICIYICINVYKWRYIHIYIAIYACGRSQLLTFLLKLNWNGAGFQACQRLKTQSACLRAEMDGHNEGLLNSWTPLYMYNPYIKFLYIELVIYVYICIVTLYKRNLIMYMYMHKYVYHI